MTSLLKKRFDDRILGKEDDGDAFERFVDEFLRTESPGSGLVRGLARGADGAIDLADPNNKISQIVECKFIGSNTTATAKERWGEVKRHLEANLPPLAAGEESRRKKYRPWLKSQSDLETYTFVTSAICGSADERNQLRKSISDFFAALSMQHEELSHLKNLTIDLRYWDDLLGQCAQFVPLFYRWFGGFPQGYGEIALSFGSKTGFKQFLASGNLRYFSRDNYLNENKLDAAHQIDTALEHLTQGNESRAQVIFGPGGIGKTRLSIEICEKARELGWWPIRLERKARVAQLDSLCQSHADSAKLLLFIDYAEAFEDLDQMPEALVRLATDGNHRISVLATTRSSSLQKVKDRLLDVQMGHTDMTPAAEQDGYVAWLVRKIVNHFDIPKPEEIAKSCAGLPVMAAFAGFLYLQDRKQFDLQFGNLAAVNDFNDWSDKRLAQVENRFPGEPVQALLAELSVRLPMPLAEVEVFRAAPGLRRNLFDLLRTDRWIEAEGDIFSAAHDVLADAMLVRHLSAMPGNEQERLQDIVVEALLEDRLDRCLAAIDRLGDHPLFDKLSGKGMVTAMLRRANDKTLAALPDIIRSRLLPPAELIALLAASSEVRACLADMPRAHLPIALAAEWAATTGGNQINRVTAEAALNELLGCAVKWPHPNNMILRCAHAFDPAQFHDDVVRRIQAEPIAVDTHYLIVSLLKWGSPPQEVLPFLTLWLTRNKSGNKAAFVYQAWLDASGGVEAIRVKLLEWVAAHGTMPEADFVYKAWLDAQLPYNEIRENCEKWFVGNWKLEGAVFVSKALSSRDDLPPEISSRIVAWSGVFAEHEDAVFRLSRVSRILINSPPEWRFWKILEKSTASVFQHLLCKEVLSVGEQDACSILFGNFARSTFARGASWSFVLDLFCSCIRHGGIFRHFPAVPGSAWTLLLHDALAEGLLDHAADRAAIIHAHELVQESVLPDDYRDLIAQGYLLQPPTVP